MWFVWLFIARYQLFHSFTRGEYVYASKGTHYTNTTFYHHNRRAGLLFHTIVASWYSEVLDLAATQYHGIACVLYFYIVFI